MTQLTSTDERALMRFSSLPDCARVRLPVVCLLFGISTATAWRWSHSGRLPSPCKISGVTFWNVGELRQHLSKRGSSGFGNPGGHGGEDPV